jgi:hypothetical protein
MTNVKTGSSPVAVIAAVAVAAVVATGVFMTRPDRDVKPSREQWPSHLPTGAPANEPAPATTASPGLERIVASVVFKPTRRAASDPVHIIISAGPVVVAEELAVTSPYNAAFDVPRGTPVLVSARQENEGTLDCVLQADGVIVDTNHTDVAGDAIRCWHNRREG